MKGLPFDFEMPISFFEKAGTNGRERRIGGIASTDLKDRQDEVVIQKGLDFSEFIKHGWFNDNHSKDTDGVIGYPEYTAYFHKGQALPDGTKAGRDGHWVEGYLLKTKRADGIWDLGKSLQETNRRLGFSVEGSVLKRLLGNRNVVTKAKVRNVAITNCPINTDTRMEILAKSLRAVDGSLEYWEKALGMGTPTPGVAVTGAKTGMGAGQVLAQESLERKKSKNEKEREDDEEDGVIHKGISDDEAFDWALKHIPTANKAQLKQFLEITKALKRKGQLY